MDTQLNRCLFRYTLWLLNISMEHIGKLPFFIDDLPEIFINTPDIAWRVSTRIPRLFDGFCIGEITMVSMWKFHMQITMKIYDDQPWRTTMRPNILMLVCPHLVGESHPSSSGKAPPCGAWIGPWCCTAVGNSPGVKHLEKYEKFVNGKDNIPYMKWKIKVMFQSTNQFAKLTYD